MGNSLADLGIKRWMADGGCCKGKGRRTYVYGLPVRLEEGILPFVQPYGKSVFSFEKTSLLKIETKELSIVGIRMMSQLRFTLKDKTRTDLLDDFEGTVVRYVEQRLGEKTPKQE